MEKVEGSSLRSGWESMSNEAKISIVELLAGIQLRLLSVHFSRYGNLYFGTDIDESLFAPKLYKTSSPGDEVYRISPSSLAKFWELERAAREFNSGPCM